MTLSPDVALEPANLEVDDVDVRLEGRLEGERALAKLAVEQLLLLVHFKKYNFRVKIQEYALLDRIDLL